MEIRTNATGRRRNGSPCRCAHGGHIQVPSLCGWRVIAVTMETEIQEEGSCYYGDERSIRSPTRAAAEAFVSQKHMSI